jgi:GNAT superfamily N-acetyltransferase
MPEIRYHPALPAEFPTNGFLQTITLVDGKKTIGLARWHCGAELDGAVQLVELLIDDQLRRKGNGSAILAAVIEQARAYHQLRKSQLRRMWAHVAQKSQINARAFLGRHGFHHISTITNLLKRQDGLIYMKTFD